MDEADVVVFRRWKGGDVIALFPELPADMSGVYVNAYEHVGQHGGANYHAVIHQTKPCSTDQAADLANELTRIGYRLKPIERANRRHHDRRRQIASDLRQTL
jgi:hypothetical protein